MSKDVREELDRIHQQVRAAFRALSSEQKVERLKELGILDKEGHLSSRYGGEGEFTEDEQPLAG